MRRLGITTSALAVAALAAGCGPNSNDVIACDSQGCISEAKLLQTSPTR